MTNPPDFVMYVVMVRQRESDPFNPCWGEWGGGSEGVHSKGFARKRDAQRYCRFYRTMFGKKNAYVQQYGPYS